MDAVIETDGGKACGLAPQRSGSERVDLGVGGGDGGIRIRHHAVGGNDLDIRDADKAQDVTQVAGGEIHLRSDGHTAGGNGDDGAFALQQAFGAGFGVSNVTPARATRSIQALSAAGTPKL